MNVSDSLSNFDTGAGSMLTIQQIIRSASPVPRAARQRPFRLRLHLLAPSLRHHLRSRPPPHRREQPQPARRSALTKTRRSTFTCRTTVSNPALARRPRHIVRCISTEGVPVLGPEASSGYFTIDGTIALNGADGTSLYLNVDESAATSYKALTFDSAAVTTDWGLEGDTIITTSPRQLNFLACATSDATVYDVYLQEGNDTPSGQTCSLTSLHLPCLC